MTQTTKRRIFLAFLASVFLMCFGVGASEAATPSKATTKTVTTWNATHTVKVTRSHTVRENGTTDSITVTSYKKKVAGKPQIKISQHKVSESRSISKNGSVKHTRTTIDVKYDALGQEVSETRVREDI